MSHKFGFLVWEGIGLVLLFCAFMLFKTDQMTERCGQCDRLLHECDCPHSRA